MAEIQRYYILGSEWLYYKLYMGSQTSEQFLIMNLKPIAEELVRQKIIDKWFFINYTDPNRHIRVRFHLTDKHYLNHVIQLIHDAIMPLAESKQITEIKTDIYKRELERYGNDTINEFETLFFLNSNLVINILERIDGDPDKRWLFALKAIDVILNDWGLDISEKSKLFGFLESSFTKEMGSTTPVNRQLSDKFRTHRSSILDIIENGNPLIDDILSEYSTAGKPVVTSILEKINKSGQDDSHDRLASYIHMHCNRVFSSRQRLNEWVLYVFLYRHYKSEAARNKN